MKEKEIKIFCMVADCGNCSEVARALGMSPSSILRTIERIEKELGTLLFYRDKTLLTLTVNGTFIRNQLEREMSISQQLARFIKEQHTNPVRIGYSFPASRHLVFPNIYRLRQFLPEVRITLVQEDKYWIRHLLSEGELDIAVLPDRISFGNYRIIETVSDYDWIAAVPSGVPLSDRRYLEPSDLKGIPLLVPIETTCAAAISEWFGDSNKLNNADTYNNMETLTGLINNGFGYGFAPVMECSYLHNFNISTYICHPKIVTSIYVYMKCKNDLSDTLRKTMDHYKAGIR